tara:strand:- start:235 stop:501 length:267 start_codon:yes stop_codon:yes gene_type:complete
MSINTIKVMFSNELNLPPHVISNIMYEQGGIEHPTAVGIKEYWHQMRIEQNVFTKMINYGRKGKWVTEHRESPHPMFFFPIQFKAFIL